MRSDRLNVLHISSRPKISRNSDSTKCVTTNRSINSSLKVPAFNDSENIDTIHTVFGQSVFSIPSKGTERGAFLSSKAIADA